MTDTPGLPPLHPTRGGAFTLAGPAGRLECLLDRSRVEPKFVAVVCHPHPVYGGTMRNKVTHRIAVALAHAGGASFRFNFRGVGLSAGVHDSGRGETDDLMTVLANARVAFPELPILVAGYSFGAWVGLRVGSRDDRVRALIGVGLATTIHSFTELIDCRKPRLFVQGAVDPLGPIDDVRSLVERMAPPHRLVVVDDANHFFEGAHIEPLVAAVAGFAAGATAPGGFDILTN